MAREHTHARLRARCCRGPWAAAERQQQAARPCLTRQHGRGVPSLARNGRRKEQRSSARAEERNAKPHTQARAAYPDAPAPLRRQEPPARDAHYARCARRAGVDNAADVAVHGGLKAVDEGAFEVRQRIKPPLNSGLPYPPYFFDT